MNTLVLHRRDALRLARLLDLLNECLESSRPPAPPRERRLPDPDRGRDGETEAQMIAFHQNQRYTLTPAERTAVAQMLRRERAKRRRARGQLLIVLVALALACALMGAAVWIAGGWA